MYTFVPIAGGFTITPNDSNELAKQAVAFSVNVTGDIKFTMADGTEATLTAQAGVVYYIPIRKVYSTGTAATGIVGYYS